MTAFKRRLGRILAHLRTQQNMTQADAAKIAGMSRTAYTNVETGRHNIALATLLKLRAAWEFSLDDVMDMAERPITLGKPTPLKHKPRQCQKYKELHA